MGARGLSCTVSRSNSLRDLFVLNSHQVSIDHAKAIMIFNYR